MDFYLGQIIMVAFNFAPPNWALCNGQLLNVNQNSALFGLLGTTYGGNGSTTFGLPNLQSRIPVGAGQGTGLSPYVWGQSGGVENVTLLTTQMPTHNHNHLVNGTAASGSGANPAGSYLGNTTPPRGGAGTAIYAATTDNSLLPATTITPAGGNQPHSNVQPYIAMYYLICTTGVYPSRP